MLILFKNLSPSVSLFVMKTNRFDARTSPAVLIQNLRTSLHQRYEIYWSCQNWHHSYGVLLRFAWIMEAAIWWNIEIMSSWILLTMKVPMISITVFNELHMSNEWFYGTWIWWVQESVILQSRIFLMPISCESHRYVISCLNKEATGNMAGKDGFKYLRFGYITPVKSETNFIGVPWQLKRKHALLQIYHQLI